jgi:hypothetical protein
MHNQWAGALSVTQLPATLYEPVFSDAYSGGRGKADVVDSVYPDVCAQ